MDGTVLNSVQHCKGRWDTCRRHIAQKNYLMVVAAATKHIMYSMQAIIEKRVPTPALPSSGRRVVVGIVHKLVPGSFQGVTNILYIVRREKAITRPYYTFFSWPYFRFPRSKRKSRYHPSLASWWSEHCYALMMIIEVTMALPFMARKLVSERSSLSPTKCKKMLIDQTNDSIIGQLPKSRGKTVMLP